MELRLAQASNASVTCHDSVIKGTRKDAAARFDSCITRAKESNENRRSFLANPGYVRFTLRSATVSNEPAFFVLLHFFACPCDALSKIFSKMHSSWSYPRCADKYLLNLERKSTRKTDRRLSCSCNNTLRRGKYSTKNSLVLESVSIYSTRKRRCQYSLFWSAGAKHISSQYREYVLDVVIGYC